MALTEYKTGTAFPGVIGRTADVSTPAKQTSAAGPYDRWPLGRGFERYYGFWGGDTHQYYPELVRDNSQTEPETTPEAGHHLTVDLVEVDGRPVGTGDLPVTIPLSLGLAAGVAIGADPGSPTMNDYQPPFRFTGEVHRALVDVTGDAVEDYEARMRMYLARQ